MAKSLSIEPVFKIVLDKIPELLVPDAEAGPVLFQLIIEFLDNSTPDVSVSEFASI